MINLITPCFRRYDLLVGLFNSAEAGVVKPSMYVFIDTGKNHFHDEGLKGYMRKNGITFPDNVAIIEADHNFGTVKTYNYALENFDDYIIIANDDIRFGPHTIQRLVMGAVDNPDKLVVFGQYAFSCFLIRRRALEVVGRFDDKNFYPIYFDDNDYAYRMKLLGHTPLDIPNLDYHHEEGGSATLKVKSAKEMEAHHNSFKALAERYERKWGGPPGHERYTQPFNGEGWRYANA